MGGKWKKHKRAAEEVAAAGGILTANGDHMEVDKQPVSVTAHAAPTEVAAQEHVPLAQPEVVQQQHAPAAHHQAAPAAHHQAAPAVQQQPTMSKKQAKRAAQQSEAKPQQGAAPAAGSQATLSIAIPGSVIEHAPNPEVAAAIAAQIARAAAIFSVDEVVVYNDCSPSTSAPDSISVATATLARLLQYIETPGHLRAALFPGSVAYPELRAAEALCPTLQAPHHLRGQEWQPYREGVVMRSEAGMGSFVDTGYDRNAHVDADLPVSRRVTLHVGPAPRVEFVPAFSETMLKAEVVAPSEPRQRTGRYWGFTVRLASSLSRALKEAPHKGYDLIVGTSRQGVEREVAELVLPRYKHGMVLFGGAKGLEEVFEEDEALAQSGKGPSDLCSLYLNCCPGQGVAAMRTEDAVPVCLAYLHASMQKFGSR